MDLEAEKKKEEKLRDRRINILVGGAFGYSLLAIVVSTLILPMPVVAQVLVPFSVGVSVGIIISIISVKLNYETSVRLLEIQQAIDELKKHNSDSK